ncbi:putative baseplate assembly protein [Kitasatospora sp. NPDC087314]|uniref:putative baseplate assembly protein n=1 Tax=Kitasatospora sp. NPDC087314 TaxID=3364068 RepID=UPI00381AE0CC
MTNPDGPTGRPTANPPGQTALVRRISTHARAMAEMRATLQQETQPPAVRALARRPADEPAIALLDGWAVVADVVSFYTERIAQEGYLRTATELRSVRELTRSLGHELDPGVSAEAELAFTVEEAVGAPPLVTVPKGTLVQSVPAQNQTPQVFRTDDDLDAQAAWNAVPAIATDPQPCGADTERLWLTGTALGLRAGDTLLALGPVTVAPASAGAERAWAVLLVTAVATAPPGHPGWTLLDVHAVASQTRPESTGTDTGTDGAGPGVHTFAERTALFGWNAPAAGLLPAAAGAAPCEQPPSDVLRLDGDHPRILPGSWLVAQSDQAVRPYRVTSVVPSGLACGGLSGRTTLVHVDEATTDHFDARTTVVQAQSTKLPAAVMPRTRPVAGRTMELAATDPPLPPGRTVLLRGTDTATGTTAVERAVVLASAVDDAGTVMTVTLDRELDRAYHPDTVTVHGNVVRATHGEPVHQVLGSGDGARTFHRLRTRRGPLTHRRVTAAAEPTSTLEIQVDGAPWSEVPSLATAGPHDPVYAVRAQEDGTVEVVFGDGLHGARLPTGTENITADYRVGTGTDGALDPGQLTLPLNRPLGIATVTNPAATHGWARPAALADARADTPTRIRTLGRVVSVADHEDFARAFAGIGAARADTVRNGSRPTVVVTATGEGASPVDDTLLAALASALADVRDPGAPLLVLPAATQWYGVRVEVSPDPGADWFTVRQHVTEALRQEFAPGRRPFGPPVTDSAVLTVVRAVPGVTACTLPRLLRLATDHDPLPPDTASEQVLGPAPADWESGAVRPARLLGLAAGVSEIRRMTS